MKKILIIPLVIIALSLLLQNNADAQEATTSPKNEIKINLLNSVLGLPEITYEHSLESNMAIGLAIGVGMGNSTDDFSQYKFLAIPYYRVYFGSVDGAGFFIEGNAGLGNVKENFSNIYYPNNQPIVPVTKFNFGLGAAIGKKYLTKNGFLGEITGGVGRFFGENRSVDVYPRIGISLGKRF